MCIIAARAHGRRVVFFRRTGERRRDNATGTGYACLLVCRMLPTVGTATYMRYILCYMLWPTAQANAPTSTRYTGTHKAQTPVTYTTTTTTTMMMIMRMVFACHSPQKAFNYIHLVTLSTLISGNCEALRCVLATLAMFFIRHKYCFIYVMCCLQHDLRLHNLTVQVHRLAGKKLLLQHRHGHNF